VVAELAVEHPVVAGRRVAFLVPVCRVVQPVAAEPAVVERLVVAALRAEPVVAPRVVEVAAVALAQ
jgi:hypothetical protein